MEEVNKIDLWDCVDDNVVEIVKYGEMLELLEDNLNALFEKKNELSGYAVRQLNNLCSLCCIIREGFKLVEDSLEKGLHNDT